MIYNPFSGKKRNHKAFPVLLKKLSEMGYQLTTHQLARLTNTDNPIKKACQNKYDAIFIAGGDGTINQSIQYLAEELYRPKVGVFPFGTSNEFAQYIGVPSNIVDALSVIENGLTKPIDIGKFGNRYFANIAAAGWLSDITYNTSGFLKSYLGEWAYFLNFLKTLLFTKQPDTISIDVFPNEVISDISLFLLMNGSSVGPFEHLIKNATNNDGYFHLLTCKKTNRLRLLFSLLANKLYLAENTPIINTTKIKSGSFMLPESIAINLDGEKAQVNNLEFKVLPHHLHVFTSNENTTT